MTAKEYMQKARELGVKKVFQHLMFLFWGWLHQKSRHQVNKVLKEQPTLKKEVKQTRQQIETDRHLNTIFAHVQLGRKNKGKKDRSQRIRSNKRKAKINSKN